MKKIESRWFILSFFFIISAVLFYKGFLGYTIQGADAPLGYYKNIAPQIKNMSSIWSDFIWMGIKWFNIYPSLYNLLIVTVKPEWVQFLNYFITSFIALVFTYLFLRRTGLGLIASIFGAIAYAVTPPIMSLVYAGHVSVISLLPYVPIIFYMINIIFDKDNKSVLNIILGIISAGAVWGLMMSSDVQRGVYYSVFAGIYILHMIFEKNEIKIKSLINNIQKKDFWMDILKVLLIFIIMILTFWNGLITWTGALKGRSNIADPSSSSSAAEEKWNFATSWSFHPAELIDNIAFGYHGNLSGDQASPYWGTKEYCGNSEALGFFVILFFMIGVFAYYKKSSLIKLFFWSGIVFLLLSFGKFLPGSPLFWLFYHIPLMNNFRGPAKFISVAAFAIAVISAYGIEFILNGMKENAERYKKFLLNILRILGGFAGIGIIWLFIVLIASGDITQGISAKIGTLANTAVTNIIYSLLRMIIYTALSFGLIYLLNQHRKSDKKTLAVVSAFIILCTLDLLNINLFYINKAYITANEFYKPDGVVNFLSKEYEKEYFRVGTSLYLEYQGDAVPIPTTALKGQYISFILPYFQIQQFDLTAVSSKEKDLVFFSKAIQGSSILPMRTLDDVINANVRLFKLCNIKYLINDGYFYMRLPNSPYPLPIFMNLSNNANFNLAAVVQGYDRPQAIFEVKNTFPRIGFYANFNRITNNEDALRYISDPSFDIEKTAVLTIQDNNILSSTNSTKKIEPQKILSYKAWDVKAEVVAPADGLVIMATKYDPDWRIYIDGKRDNLYTVNYLQMGSLIKKGNHTVEFRFEPDKKPFIVSLMITIFAIFSTIFLIVRYSQFKEKNG